MGIDDIKTGWLSVARRGQSVAKSQGLSIVTITILCDAEGEAVAWGGIDQIKLEPKATAEEALMSVIQKMVRK